MRFNKLSFLPLALGVLFLAPLTVACDGGEQKEEEPKKKPRSLSDLKQAGPDATPEELEAARKKAGFKSAEEIAAENAAMFEKGAREYVKTRLKEYRALVGEFEGQLAQVEKEAGKWAKAKDSAKAFEKFSKKFKERTKEFRSEYDTLTGHGAEGGNTQVLLGKAYRGWENLRAELGPKISEQERFAQVLGELRAQLAEVGKALGEIEKDEELKVDANYKPPKKK